MAAEQAAAQLLQLVAFVPVAYVPLAQGVHSRSLTAVPGADTYVPAGQLIQTAHSLVFALALKLPFGHDVQPRSRVALGVVETYEPPPHVVHSSQSVAFAVEL